MEFSKEKVRSAQYRLHTKIDGKVPYSVVYPVQAVELKVFDLNRAYIGYHGISDSVNVTELKVTDLNSGFKEDVGITIMTDMMQMLTL